MLGLKLIHISKRGPVGKVFSFSWSGPQVFLTPAASPTPGASRACSRVSSVLLKNTDIPRDGSRPHSATPRPGEGLPREQKAERNLKDQIDAETIDALNDFTKAANLEPTSAACVLL